MLVEQIAVFIENKKGRLSAITKILAENGINITALSLAESEEYGMLRMIVSEPHKAKEILSQKGVVCKVSKVLQIEINDVAGEFSKIVNILSNEEIEIYYMYASVSKNDGKALMIFNVDNVELAQKVIEKVS